MKEEGDDVDDGEGKEGKGSGKPRRQRRIAQPPSICTTGPDLAM